MMDQDAFNRAELAAMVTGLELDRDNLQDALRRESAERERMRDLWRAEREAHDVTRASAAQKLHAALDAANDRRIELVLALNEAREEARQANLMLRKAQILADYYAGRASR